MCIFVGEGYLDVIENEVHSVLCGQFGKRKIISHSTMLKNNTWAITTWIRILSISLFKLDLIDLMVYMLPHGKYVVTLFKIFT